MVAGAKISKITNIDRVRLFARFLLVFDLGNNHLTAKPLSAQKFLVALSYIDSNSFFVDGRIGAI